MCSLRILQDPTRDVDDEIERTALVMFHRKASSVNKTGFVPIFLPYLFIAIFISHLCQPVVFFYA